MKEKASTRRGHPARRDLSRGCLALFLVGAFTRPTGAATTSVRDPAEGLWAAQVHLGTVVLGDLRVTRHGKDLSASIGEIQVRFPPRGDSVQFALPGGRGRFRGAWSSRHEAIEGFWIRASGSGPGDPGWNGQSCWRHFRDGILAREIIPGVRRR